MYVASGKTAEEIVRMVVAGASVSIDATMYQLPDLLRLAAVVSSKPGATVTLRNAGQRRTEGLMRLAMVSRGRMKLEF